MQNPSSVSYSYQSSIEKGASFDILFFSKVCHFLLSLISAPCFILLAVGIENKCTNILRDDFSGSTFKFDQFLEVGQRHEGIRRQLSGLLAQFSRREDLVLKEVAEFLNVLPVILTVELLEDCENSIDVVRTIYRELYISILTHYTVQHLVIAEVLEHAQSKYGEEARHCFKPQSDRINLVHRIYVANCLTANG